MATNYVGTVTIATGASAGLFSSTSVTPAAGEWYVLGTGGPSDLTEITQVNTGTFSATAAKFPVASVLKCGGAEVYIQNNSISSVTLLVKFASTA